jgi:hypothetical protein
MSTLSTLIQYTVTEIKQEKKNRRKEGIRLSLFACDGFLYLKDPNDSTKKTLRFDKHFQSISMIQVNIQISIAFLYTNNKHAEREIRKTIPVTIASKIT